MIVAIDEPFFCLIARTWRDMVLGELLAGFD
jgi:hypothetical protein